jgi:hypothetical protein
VLLPQLKSIEAVSSHFIMGESETALRPLLSPLFYETLLECPYSGDCGSQRFCYPHAALIGAFGHAGRSIRQLQFTDMAWELGGRPSPSSVRLHEKQCQDSFSKPHILGHDISDRVMGSVADTNSPLSRLVAFLSAAPLLESLHLGPLFCVSSQGWLDVEEADFTDAFTLLTWPNFRVLGFWCCQTDREAFTGLMERHAETLE